MTDDEHMALRAASLAIEAEAETACVNATGERGPRLLLWQRGYLADQLRDTRAELARMQPVVAACAAIGEELATQDNLATADPVFIVQQKRRIYGGDDGTGMHVWINDGYEADADEAKRLDAMDRSFETVPDEWTRVDYTDTWEFVQACFTRKAAQRYLDENRHNLTEPRVYVDSAYRNREWIGLRATCALAVEAYRRGK